MKTRLLSLQILPLILACALAGPASAGEDVRTVTLFSDGKGNAAWVDLDRTDGRMEATPYLRVSEETVRRTVETADRAGEAQATVAPLPGKPDPAARTDRKAGRREAIASLLEGPDGISFGRLLDIAHDASESAEHVVRQWKTAAPAGHTTEDPP